tara:strand:- start:2212 stop:2640 length:429 start_codon:yes stop_codon:yes gene_type:complete
MFNGLELTELEKSLHYRLNSLSTVGARQGFVQAIDIMMSLLKTDPDFSVLTFNKNVYGDKGRDFYLSACQFAPSDEKFVIVHEKISGMFWSNNLGWVDLASAHRFPSKDNYDLPMEGVWIEAEQAERVEKEIEQAEHVEKGD